MIPKKFILIRESNNADVPFLFATYLKHNWYDKTNTSTLKKETWMGLQRKRLENVLKTQSVKVAVLSSDQDVILGYGFWDASKPFIYIKQAWRDKKFQIKDMLIDEINEGEIR